MDYFDSAINCPTCNTKFIYNLKVECAFKSSDDFHVNEENNIVTVWNLKNKTGEIYIHYKCKNGHQWYIYYC